ncbi:decarboxylase [Micromonospora arborensis]|uniref:Decarboxylase n=1 Tax=Micromonospora arborensis TaxID=2116518 RepID=A0A318NED1_9ACTN|nr:type III PLP-dependent enzyme [Micromonospora arborensis]PYC66958.1 decarboxylase [Micromonospora arborensis]
MSAYAHLAERYGTPLYVYDLDRVEAAREALKAALPEAVDLFYAVKANPHAEVAAAVRGADRTRAEISSTGELAVAIEAGFAAADCLYTGPGKTTGELDVAIGRGVRTFSAESPGDLRRIGRVADRHGVVVDCLLRVNSAAAKATTSSIRMTGAPSQFGLDSETLPDVLPELTRVPGTRLAGAHFFPLSSAADEESLIAEFQHTIGLAARLHEDLGLPLRLLDIGGGFSVPYATPGPRARYDKLRSELESALDTSFPRWRDGEPRIACESGRYLVGDGGTLLCGVVNVKESRQRRFVVLDAGINTFGGLSGLGRLLPAKISTAAEPVQVASLVGPLCTPGDVLARDVPLPDLAPGDVLEIPNAGAYGPSASLLAFLGRPAPAEVVVRGDEVLSVSRLDYRRVYGPAT